MEVTRIVRRPAAKKRIEEATRITRQPLPKQKALAAPSRPAAVVKVVAVKAAPMFLPLARFALVALVFGKERAAELLEGLGAGEATRAKEHLAHFMALTSAERQARVALEFGMRGDPADQLRELMAEAPEALRREIFRKLAPYHRSLFPQRRLEMLNASATPAMSALAERLIREATR